MGEDDGMLQLTTIGARMPRQKFSRPEPKRSKEKPYRWMGQWHIYRIVDGAEKRHHIGPIVLGPCATMTKTEAQTELDRRLEDSKKSAVCTVAPRESTAAAGTVAAELAEFLRLNESAWEPETMATHRSIIARQILPALGAMKLTEVTREVLQSHLNALAEAGRSHSTVKKARNLLGTMFADALEDGKIVRNPMRKVRMPRTRKPERRYLTELECNALIAAAHGRDRLMIRLCVVLGLRPGEMLALRRDDVEPGRIRIDEASREGTVKKPKTDASAAYVVLPPGLEVELRHWLETSPEDPEGFIFPSERAGKPIRQNNFRKRVLAPLAEAVGLSGVTFQAFRRTTATHAQSVGSVKDAQTMLRHASPDMTVGTYMQAIPESVRAAVEALETKIGGKVQ